MPDLITIIVVTIERIIFNDKVKKIFSSIPSILCSKKNISNHFKSDIPDNTEIKYFFYQLGLRKNLPIMDWLYFEYIKYLSKRYKIEKLVVFPTIDTPGAPQLESDFSKFRENVNKIFKDSSIVLDFVPPHQDLYFDKEDLISEDFITALKYIGSKEYFGYLWKTFKIRVFSISDFNKYRPNDDKIKNIFIHIYKSWSIVNYVKKNINLDKSVNISAIFWEWQVDKLGIIRHYLKNKATFHSVLGLTQNVEDIEHEPICIFDDINSKVEKIIKSMPSLKKYNLLLENILLEYGEDIEKKIKSIRNNGGRIWRTLYENHDDMANIENFKPSKDFFMFLGLIEKIRLIIENENT